MSEREVQFYGGRSSCSWFYNSASDPTFDLGEFVFQGFCFGYVLVMCWLYFGYVLVVLHELYRTVRA